MIQRVLRHLVASFPVPENPLNTVRSGLLTRPQQALFEPTRPKSFQNSNR